MGGWPSAVRAQQKAMPVIGYLVAGSSGPTAPNIAAFHRELSEAGYVEGQNLVIEYRWAEGRYDRLPALAADLVDRKVDVIVPATTPAALAARNATPLIPIVFVAVADPLATGLVTSLARPGGNITGISVMAAELMPKRLELLSELAPRAKVIALLVNPNNANTGRMIADLQAAALEKGVQVPVLNAGTEVEIDTVFAMLVQREAGALVVAADPFLFSRQEQLTTLAARHALPAIYEFREFAAVGGLISYGPSIIDTYRKAGAYVGRILKGVKPADLPVQQPTRFELVVNLKTAKALGLTIPPAILARADEVIE
jgi:putative ABC transport system substrate-binding protein